MVQDPDAIDVEMMDEVFHTECRIVFLVKAHEVLTTENAHVDAEVKRYHGDCPGCGEHRPQIIETE